MPESPVPTVIRTLRFKVRREGYAWLEAAAVEVNQVWNWSNSVSDKAARPFAGPPRWLSGFDLDKLSAGATKYFEHIGADTIQKVNAEFARRRRQFRKTKLRWRVSRGRRKSLGWIPMKAASLRRKAFGFEDPQGLATESQRPAFSTQARGLERNPAQRLL